MEIPKIKNSLVVSSNDLVHAKYDLTLWQKRVFIYALSQLDKNDTDFKPVKMEINDIIRFFKSTGGSKAYNSIISAPKSLDKTIEIPYMTEQGGLRYGYVRLLQKYTIPSDDRSDNQYIEIRFNDDLKPHLLELKEKFLRYDIENIIELQSTYSFRMFEILKSHEYRQSIELEVDFLREILEVVTIYKAYKDFKKRVIEKAQEDLTKFCDISFTYEEKKGVKGKKIESLVFHIHKNKPTHRENDTSKDSGKKYVNVELAEVISDEKTVFSTGVVAPIEVIEVIEVIEAIEANSQEQLIVEFLPIVVSQFGVSYKMFMNLIEQHIEGDIRRAVLVTQKAMQKGKIEHIAGFFVEAVRGNYQDKEAQKKQIEADKLAQQKAKQAKEAALKQAEQAVQWQREQTVRNESNRKIAIIEGLIRQDSPLMRQAVEELRRGIVSTGYDPNVPIADLLKNAMIAGKLMTVLQKIEPTIFS
jgi:plasmid replication initiation protein